MRLMLSFLFMGVNCSFTVFALDKPEQQVLGKLKLILVTQSVVHAEHAAVHLHAKNQATQMVELFNQNDENGMSCLLEKLCFLSEEAEKLYRKNAKALDESLIERLCTSQKLCVRWSLAIGTGKTLPRKKWTQFRQVFWDKAETETLLFTKAMSAKAAFSLGIDLSCVLSKEPAVTAWCVDLPALD